MRFSAIHFTFSLLLLSACSPSAPSVEVQDRAVQEVENPEQIESVADEDEDVEGQGMMDEGMMEEGADMMDGGMMEEWRTVEMQASNWAFTPATIAVKQGERIRLKIVGESGVHGFAIPALGVNVHLNPGQTAMVDLPTDQAGVFDAKCSIPCGSGHRDMKATVVIEQ